MKMTLTISGELANAIMAKHCPIKGAVTNQNTGTVTIDVTDDVYRERILHVIADLGVESISMSL